MDGGEGCVRRGSCLHSCRSAHRGKRNCCSRITSMLCNAQPHGVVRGSHRSPPPLVRADEQQLINCPGKWWGKASWDWPVLTLGCKPCSAESRIRPVVFNASASKLPLNNTVYLWLIEAKNFAITDKRGRSAPHFICIFKDRGFLAARLLPNDVWVWG